MTTTNLLSKLPPVVQMALGFAVIALGMYTAVFAILWSGGDPLMQYVLCSIAAIYMLIGLTPTIEGVMTINAAVEEQKKLAAEEAKTKSGKNGP